MCVVLRACVGRASGCCDPPLPQLRPIRDTESRPTATAHAAGAGVYLHLVLQSRHLFDGALRWPAQMRKQQEELQSTDLAECTFSPKLNTGKPLRWVCPPPHPRRHMYRARMCIRACVCAVTTH